MKTRCIVLTTLLFYVVLSLWIEDRLAWSLFQTGVFLLVVWGRFFRMTPRFPAHPELAVILASCVWPFVQLALNSTVSRGDTWNAALNWFSFAVVFLVSYAILSDTASLRWFLRAVAVFGMVVATLACLQKYTSPGAVLWLFPSGYSDDVMGPFLNRDHFAAWIELILPVPLYLAVTERRLRALFTCAAVTMFAALVASASRAGFSVAVLEVAVTILVIARRQLVSRKLLVAGIAQFTVLVCLAVAVGGWQGLATRFQIRQPDRIRWDALRASASMVHDRPWMGSGLGTWPTVYPRYAAFDAGVFVNQAHNDWAQWAAEGGIPFVLLLAAFAVLLCKPAFRSIYGLGTLAFLLHAVVDYPMQQRPGLAAWFFAIAGATMAGSRGGRDT